MEAFHARLAALHDVDLGRLDVSLLTHKQLNTLLLLQSGLSRHYLRLFFDAAGHLIVTSDYRYERAHQDTRYQAGWFTMQLDFVFGKRPDLLDED